MPWVARLESRRAGEICFIVFSYMLNSSISLTATTTVASTTCGSTPKSGITEDLSLQTPDPGNLTGGRERGRAGLCPTDTKGDPAGILGSGGREKIHTAPLSQMQGLNSNISFNLRKAKYDVKKYEHAWAHQEHGQGGYSLGGWGCFKPQQET